MGGNFRVGGWLVERDLNRISNGDKSAQLEPKVVDVLVALADRAGEVLSRDALLRACWPGTHVTDEVLTYSIFELRKAFEDDAKKPRVIQTVPRRGYRLIAEVTKDPNGTGVPPEPASPALDRRFRKPSWLAYAVGAVIILLALLVLWYRPWRTALSDTDSILLTDFENTTGDAVFDGTLKHALAMHLSQSPFLNIFPEERARETLPYMERSPDAPVTREIGREICVRRGIKAMLAGSIARLGRNYVLSLEALNGQTGEVIAREQVEVESKEEILRRLGAAASRIRRQLGESLSYLERFDVPLEQATTPSLEAFQHYSTGRRNLVAGKMSEAIPHYLEALEHDPNFASAYDDLAWCYESLAQCTQAAECARKAYALRDRVSEYERLSIDCIYYTVATGEVLKAIETLEIMRTTYPRSAPVHNTLAGRYASVGRFEEAVQGFREAIRLNGHPNAYTNLASLYLRLGRLTEASQVLEDAKARGIDNRFVHTVRYLIAFAQGDRATMDEQVRWASGKPAEPYMLALQASAASFSGRLREARAHARKAIDLARSLGLKEAAAEFESEAARREALFGNVEAARRDSAASLAASRDPSVLARSAMSLAMCGDLDAAQALADELARRYPTHTVVQTRLLPTVRAAVELGRGNTARALELLRPGACDPPRLSLWPMYVAGEAYLRGGSAREAESEFRGVLAHRNLDMLSPLHTLAQLGIGRALVLAGDKERGRRAYEAFFAQWKDADADLPILRQARAEYTALRDTS